MTKVIILGQVPNEEKKPIEFLKEIDFDLQIIKPRNSPKEFKNIELIARKWDTDDLLDLMFAYDDDRICGYLYLGRFNDGVVE